MLFDLLFVTGTDIRQIYRHSQYQLSTLSLKTPASSSSEPQTSSTIELTTMSIPTSTDKHYNNYTLCYKNTIQNYATITNNENIQSCET